MRDAERRGCRRGEQRSGIVDGDHRGERLRLGKVHDPRGGSLDVVEIEPEVAPLHQAREGGPVLRTDDHLDPKPRRGGHEIVRAIGPAGDEQEYAGHALS